MKRRKGSFTIEATILISFILFLLMSILEMGINLYQESKNREYYDGLENMDTINKFYVLQGIGTIGEEVLEDES